MPPAQMPSRFPTGRRLLLVLFLWLGAVLRTAAATDLSYEWSPSLLNPNAATVVVAGEGVWQQTKKSDTWRPVKNGDRLALGSLLMTEPGSAAVIELPGGLGVVNALRGTVVEFTRWSQAEGTHLVLTSGRVTGEVNRGTLEIASSCGRKLSLSTPPGGSTPFEFRHGRDERHYAELERLGLVSDWAGFQPRPDVYELGFGPIPPPPEPERFSLSFEAWTLLGLVVAGFAVFLWQRN